MFDVSSEHYTARVRLSETEARWHLRRMVGAQEQAVHQPEAASMKASNMDPGERTRSLCCDSHQAPQSTEVHLRARAGSR